MRVGIFVAMVGRKAAGLESYEHGLVRGLAELDHENEYRVFCLTEQAAASFGLQQDNVRFEPLRPGIRWISFPLVLPLKVAGAGLDVLHATFVPPPLCRTDAVFTVHDIGMFTNPEFYHPALRWRMNRLIVKGIKDSRLVLCISHAIKDMVREHFGVPDSRLVTVYHGIDPHFRPQPHAQVEAVLHRHGVKPPYIIFVGQLRVGIKNLVRLLEAFAAFRREVRDAQLVLVGRRPYRARYPMAGLDETIQRLHLQPAVRELGYVTIDDLPALYAGAEMLAFPSLCEGFGFPVLEAMACGTPAVVSNIPALAEVSGGAALLVDPYSSEDIAAGMYRMFHDRQLRDSCRAKGLVRARSFTWRKTAEGVLAAYKQVCGVGPSLQTVLA
jgi:alpha-1,3-rhamnosyl/mannosyltransferase